MSTEKTKVSAASPRSQELQFINVSGESITFTVKKLPLGRVINLLNAVQQLPKEIADLDKMDEGEILQNISSLIALAIPKFVDVVVEAIDDKAITKDVVLNEFGLDDIMSTIYSILVVNNILGILGTIKKVRALTTTPQAKPAVQIG